MARGRPSTGEPLPARAETPAWTFDDRGRPLGPACLCGHRSSLHMDAGTCLGAVPDLESAEYDYRGCVCPEYRPDPHGGEGADIVFPTH